MDDTARMAYDIASPQSYEVLKARRERGELGGTYHRVIVVHGWRTFIADTDEDDCVTDPQAPDQRLSNEAQ